MDIKGKIKELLNLKSIVFIIILVLFIIIGSLVKSTFFTDEKRALLPAEKSESSIIDKGSKKAVKDERLTIDMPQEIKDLINYEKFYEDFKFFLDENKLLTEDTTAISDNVYSKNVSTKDISFVIMLNDYNKTKITVTVIDGEFKYEYY